MEIKHNNIIYMNDIPKIGGTSTYVREMAKKYKDLDIAIVYKTAESSMITELEKYCMTYKLSNWDTINCKVAIINYDSSVCDYITQGDIYMVFHADYTCPIYKAYPYFHPKIKGYISLTPHIQRTVKEKFGLDSIVCTNPNSTKKREKRLTIVSATRLSAIKGKDRMRVLGEELNRQGVKYVWYVFTNDRNALNNPNIIFMNPVGRDVTGEPDILDWMQEADFVAQLSDNEARSYTIDDALLLGTPIIVTPLPYLEEAGIKDNENAYILDFNCKNVKDVVERMKNRVPKFEYAIDGEIYDQILAKGAGTYQKDKNTFVEVECIFQGMQNGFTDVATGDFRKFGDRWQVDKVRMRKLLENPNNLVKVVSHEICYKRGRVGNKRKNA